MKTKILTLLGLLALYFGIQDVSAQLLKQEQEFPKPGSSLCSTSEVMNAYYKRNPQAKAEHDRLEVFTQYYTRHHLKPEKAPGSERAEYRIPVVCHVYGNNFWGKTLTDAQIVAALAEVNRDFQALNADYTTVNDNFASLKSGLSISFELAKLDPKGNPSNGIDRKTTSGAGYGNDDGYDAKIAADAWDCKKYMNVYIVADLYNDGVKTNSGVCWYPDVSMTNANTARCVFNGQYFGTNSANEEFRAVLTHEFGHFLNLAHTFDTGCSGSGDGVSDTPLHSSTSLGCPTGQSTKTPISDCGNWVINSENYMDYNGAFCGYKNFTKGQVARMTAALNANNVTRKPLWQTSNLIATGLLNPTGITKPSEVFTDIVIYPNPSNGIFQLKMNIHDLDQYTIELTDLLDRVIANPIITCTNGAYTSTIDLKAQPKGLYFVSICGSGGKTVVKIIKE